MTTFGERLKKERLRLKSNQSDFALIGGVQKNAQINYEKGERSPDADYLQRIAAHGADVLYLLTGVSTDDDHNKVTDADLVLEIAAHLGLYNQIQDLEEIQNQLQTERDAYYAGGMSKDDTSKSWKMIKAWINKSPLIIWDWSELEEVIEKLEFALDVTDRKMSSAAKAESIVRLFRQEKALPDGKRLPMEAFRSEVERYGDPKTKR